MNSSGIAKKEVKEKYEEWHSKTVGSDIVDAKFNKWLINTVRKEVKEKRTILDVACGRGNWLKACQKLGINCYGVDVSKAGLARAKERLDFTELVLSDAEKLPFRACSFDIVTCLGSLEHFPNPERGIEEMQRILTESGKAFVLVPNAYFLGHVYMVFKTGESPDEGGQHFLERFATKKSWHILLNSYGLKVIKCFKYNRITKASRRVSSITRIIYNILIAPVLPLNLSYAFLFVCIKSDRFAQSKRLHI